jgi:hypothetical protein
VGALVTAAMWAGEAYGLHVTAELPCLGLAPAPGVDPDDGEVRVVAGPVPARRDAAPYDRLCAQAGEGWLRVEVPGAGAFAARGGREIVVDARTGAEPAAVAQHLEETVWPGLLQQRGLLVLHAGAVRAGTGAVLIAGGSTHGKSTLAAALAVKHGLDVLADDLCAVDLDGDGRPVLHPAPAAVVLWRHAAEALGLPPLPGPGSSGPLGGTDRHRITLARAAVPAPLPVRALYLLGRDDAPSPSFTPVARHERFEAVQDAVVRPGRAAVLTGPTGRVPVFARAAALADQAPVRRVARRWYPWAVADLAAALVEDLAR